MQQRADRRLDGARAVATPRAQIAIARPCSLRRAPRPDSRSCSRDVCCVHGDRTGDRSPGGAAAPVGDVERRLRRGGRRRGCRRRGSRRAAGVARVVAARVRRRATALSVDVESARDAVGRRDGNKRGVTTSTSAINTSARRVRLSIREQMIEAPVVREPGRSRQAGTGGSGRYAAQREPAAANGAVSLERFDGVRGAAWIIAARGRQDRRERDLIRANEENEHRTHRLHSLRFALRRDVRHRQSVVERPRRSASKSTPYASRRARIATVAADASPSAGSSSSRTSSRSRRLSRLRATADCLCRGTTIPTREKSRGEARTRTSRCTVRIRFPSRMTVCRSWPRVSRLRRGNSSPSPVVAMRLRTCWAV